MKAKGTVKRIALMVFGTTDLSSRLAGQQEVGDKMTEQEFKKRLNELLWHPPKSTYASSSGGTYEDTDYYEFEKQILALIKEAGWIDPATVIMPGEYGTPKAEALMQEWAKENGYVKLASLTREERYAIWYEVELNGGEAMKEPHLKPCLSKEQVNKSRRDVDKAYELLKKLNR